MEYASFLAGERWSDHPGCTHPLLSLLARGVNDHTSDEGRPRLVPLIPSVVGLAGVSPAIDISIAMRSAAAAIPVVAMDRQKAMGVGLLVSLDALQRSRGEMATNHANELVAVATAALAVAPHATSWARGFVDTQPSRREAFATRSAPAIVRAAVTGIVDTGVADCDQRLYGLLHMAIEDCRRILAKGTDLPRPRAVDIAERGLQPKAASTSS